MKVIFLDVDGVLNNDGYFERTKNEKQNRIELDDENIKCLKEIIDLTSFSARFRKARPSGRDYREAGSPASPFSRMLWTIGIWPRRGTPYFSAILTPPVRHVLRFCSD